MNGDELRTLATDIAMGAGELLATMRAEVEGTKSSPTDLVTNADRAAESYIVSRISMARPDDSIVAEEGGGRTGHSGLTWVIDPLDGTVNYVYQIPQWCVSIGIEGALRAGVVHDPSRMETFTDGGWTIGGRERALSPSNETSLDEALIGTGFSYSASTRALQAQTATRVLPKVRDIRRAGSCALDLCWVACGRLDGFYEHDTHQWDISAGIAIVEAAGGSVSVHGSLTIAAGNAELLAKLEQLVLDGHSDTSTAE